jgi:hypothetical protein
MMQTGKQFPCDRLFAGFQAAKILLLVLAGATVALAEEVDYFPLQVGNTWTYVFTNVDPQTSVEFPDTFVVSITDTQRLDGQLYYRFQNIERLLGINLAGNLYRKDDRGDVWVWYEGHECLRFKFSAKTFAEDPHGMENFWEEQCPAPRWARAFLIWFHEVEDRLTGPFWGESPIPVAGRMRTVFALPPTMAVFFVADIGIFMVQGELADPKYLVRARINGHVFPESTAIVPTGWGQLKARQFR